MRKAVSRGELRDRLPRGGGTQVPVHARKPRLAQITHRRRAPELPEMLQQRAPGDPRGGDNLRQADWRVDVCLDEIDGTPDIRRRDRFCAAQQRLSVIVRLGQKQSGEHELFEGRYGERIGRRAPTRLLPYPRDVGISGANSRGETTGSPSNAASWRTSAVSVKET